MQAVPGEEAFVTTTTVKERPIIFTADSVRGILEGRKTQTRRVVKPQPQGSGHHGPTWGRYQPACKEWEFWGPIDPETKRALLYEHGVHRCPYGLPGDHLWVREVYRTVGRRHRGTERRSLLYPATCEPGSVRGPFKSPRFMPRWASRITLEVLDVRVQRVQEISDADAVAEGMPKNSPIMYADEPAHELFSAAAYRVAWDSINAKRGFGWDKNPWVWAVSFRRTSP
jgi:hypothetical protein